METSSSAAPGITPSAQPAPPPPPALPLSGQHIAEAARATSAVLAALLAETEVDFHGWVVLNGVATAGPVAERGQVTARLAAALHADDAPIRAAFDRLVETELVGPADGDPPGEWVRLTPAGTALHQHIRQLIGRVSAELYDGIPWGDLATTRRVLVEVTERANARLQREASPRR